jgi:hypothetical protein
LETDFLADKAGFIRRGILYGRAAPGDDGDMRAALRETPMESWISTSMEREPSFFGPDGKPGKSVPMTARTAELPHELAGLYGCSSMRIHINGAAAAACYLEGLRLRKKFRGRVDILKGGFESIPLLAPEVKEASMVFTSVASDNRPARRILEAGVRGMPRYSLLGELETFAIGTGAARNYGLLEAASSVDARELAEFHNSSRIRVQLSPVLDESWLRGESAVGQPIRNFLVHRENGRIKACVMVWDQRHHRQVVVRGYRQPIAFTRPAYNLWALASGRPVLPPAGSRLEQVFLAFIALDESVDDAEFLVSLIKEALVRAKSMRACVALFGISPKSVHRRALKHKLNPWVYRTRIEAVELAACRKPPEIEGVMQPEIALL